MSGRTPTVQDGVAVRSAQCRNWAVVATNSLVPTQAATARSGSTTTPKRRRIQSTAARRYSGDPGEVG